MNINIENIYERNELLWGKKAQELLFKKHVVVFGLGGIGSFSVDALARSGIGKLTIIDFDQVAKSNINRQLIATLPTIGMNKSELVRQRIESINPHIQVISINEFYTEKLNNIIFSEKVDFVIDAIDTLKYKIELIVYCKNNNIPVISSVGAGNRIDPSRLYIADISEIKGRKCPFVRNVKHKLKFNGIKKDLPVVFSDEKPFLQEKRKSTFMIETPKGENLELTKFTPGSSPFVPPVAGYIMASYVVRSFIGI